MGSKYWCINELKNFHLQDNGVVLIYLLKNKSANGLSEIAIDRSNTFGWELEEMVFLYLTKMEQKKSFNSNTKS